MKFIKIMAPVFAGLLMLSSCGPEKGKNISEMGNISQTDSLMYYFGQMRAGEYWREAMQDTTLKSQEARDAYLRGVQAGLDMIKAAKEGDVKADAYNQGIFMGVQLAMNLGEFEKEYSTKTDKKVLLQSFAYGLTSDTTVNVQDSQRSFYDLMNTFNAKKDEQMKKEAAETLSGAAVDLKMAKISDTLYGRVITGNPEGAAIKSGDKVKVKMTATKANGEELGIPMPEELEVGTEYGLPIFTEALESMKVGETKEFATTAASIFGNRASQFNLKGNDIVIIKISAESLIGGDEDNAPKIQIADPNQPKK